MNPELPPSDPATSFASPHKRRRLLTIGAWIVGSCAAVLLLVVLTAAFLLHSTRFHAYVLKELRRQASESLGVRVELRDFTLQLSHLSLALDDLTVDGASPYNNPPLLHVDHAEAGVRIVSLFHRKWYLENVRIDRPIIRIYVDAKGISNLPTFKSSAQTGSNNTLFDLGIRHALLNQGEVYYNDKKADLNADLHDLDFEARYNPQIQQYAGNLAYNDGHFVSGVLKPIPHSLQLSFDATPTTLHLTQAKLSSGASQLNLTATLQNYSNPVVDAHYDATVELSQFRDTLQSPSIPSGQVRATGTAHYQQAKDQSLLDSVVVNGDLSSSVLAVNTPSFRAPIRNLSAHYALARGNALLQDLRAGLLGGTLTASGSMKAIGGDSHSEVVASLKNVSLADLKNQFAKSALPPGVKLTGQINAQAKANWGKTLDDLIARADATIDGKVLSSKSVAPGTVPTSGELPINSALHGTYSMASKQVEISQSYLRTPQTTLSVNGLLSNHSSLILHLQADDLREVETVADLFRESAPGQSLQPLGLSGTASFQGSVQGTTASPHLTGQFVASNFHIHGSAWKVLRTDIDASPSSASLQHADLEPATQGHITFSASTGLNHWAWTNSSPLQLDLDATQLSIADLLKVADPSIPITGTLNTSVRLHGTALTPAGNGSVALTNLNAYGEPVQSVNLAFSGTGDEAHGDLAINLPAGKLLAKLNVRPQQKTYTAQIYSAGIQLDQLRSLKASNVDATGVLSIRGGGEGSFDDPGMNATLQIPKLVIQQQTITGLSLQVNVANHVANAALLSSAVNTSIRANARINLSGDYLTQASLDTQAIPFQPLIALYAPSQADNVTGQTEIHATLQGPLKNKALLEGHVTIPTLQLNYGSKIQLAAASPIHVDYKNGVVDVQRSAIRGTDTDLQFGGSIPTDGKGKMALLLQGTVDLQLAQLFDPDYRTSGKIKFNINSNGGANDPNIGGEIDIVNASVASADLPVGLQHGNGVLTLTRDRLNISKFQGTVGGGTLTAQGGVTYQPNLQFNLGLSAQGVRALYPQGVRESVDANIRLTGNTEHAVLGGSVNLSELSFTSGFDLSSFIGQFAGGVAAPPTQGFSQNLELNLAVRSTNDVNLVSRTLSVGGSANLQVRGTAANPVILGRVNLNNGDIILNGSRFLLTGGTIQFVNPSETEPVVNVSLNTSIQQYSIFLRFNGPINQLHTEYSSDPSLPSADIINLLAFGSTTESSATNATPANQAAESLIASQVSSQVTSRFSKIAGISQLSINPVLAGSSNQGPAGANITIQQRVTGNLFVTFSSNVASTQSQTIQGQYQVSPRVAVSATRDQNGGFAVDTIIKKTW